MTEQLNACLELLFEQFGKTISGKPEIVESLIALHFPELLGDWHDFRAKAKPTTGLAFHSTVIHAKASR